MWTCGAARPPIEGGEKGGANSVPPSQHHQYRQCLQPALGDKAGE